MAGWGKISSQIQRHPSPIQPNHLAMGPCCTWLRRQGLATQKSNAFLVVLTSLSWMLGGSFVSLLLSGTIRAQQLSQSGKISFHFSDKIKSLRVKPSQMNFYTQKKNPNQANNRTTWTSVTQDNHVLSARNSQSSPAWQNIELHATDSGGCREDEDRF